MFGSFGKLRYEGSIAFKSIGLISIGVTILLPRVFM